LDVPVLKSNILATFSAADNAGSATGIENASGLQGRDYGTYWSGLKYIPIFRIFM
jgi:hypothetical protein